MGLRLGMEIEGWLGGFLSSVDWTDGWMELLAPGLQTGDQGIELGNRTHHFKELKSDESKRRVIDVAVISSLVYFERKKGWGRYGRFSSIELRRGSDTFFF
jgi:hypothetical protein